MAFDKKEWKFEDVVTEDDANRWEDGIKEAHETIDEHVNDKNNPHSVTKSQVGLDNVDNVKQATKTEFDDHVGDNLKHKNASNITEGGSLANAEGFGSKAEGYCSHAEGFGTDAEGRYSHAEGDNSYAIGDASHAEGSETRAGVFASHAQGRYNNPMNGSPTDINNTDDAMIIGNGTSSNEKGNAFRVTFDGKVYGLSAFNSSGADYAEYLEWLDANPDKQDRVGFFVTLDGDKIKKAKSDDSFVLGIISANPSVIGDSHQDDWQGKYIRDDWGRIQYEWTTIKSRDVKEDGEEIEKEEKAYLPVLNPDWNNEEKYIPREKRPEWDAVGMLGKLLVRDDGTCQVNGYCLPNDEGIATSSETGYRVIKRVSENIVQILFYTV
ncbi:Peptidase_G2, IMC autoproteolytic cleavage domain [Gracilibacillus orientalis]|uniref:Peptidase_G2, IMC autoproteolytic cleavage domain n=1 Tax=Gracilibacillus orientalis TaxID=334253 RepID=A0A1I4PP93_9BACI|nr:peptidase G2 autoproteolytic cleavage domain-containing protein [Gracilibacillus orientalis]SFM29310.1 Peptidase_G2, IMC autoproteolytic cleavage domain [Gracilibacillus orientalis]